MGGLTREWYEVMAKAICDPNLALFASQPEFAQTYQPSKNAVIQDESMVSFRDYFRFCGRFVGKALLDGQQLSCYFTRSFYKHMLAVPLSLKDLEHVDPDYYKSLQYLLEHDVEEALPDTPFVTEVDFFGRKDLVELKPGGANIVVRGLCMPPSALRPLQGRAGMGAAAECREPSPPRGGDVRCPGFTSPSTGPLQAPTLPPWVIIAPVNTAL